MNNDQALTQFNPALLAGIIGNDALATVNDGFSAGISSGDFLPMLSIRGNRFRIRMDGEETVIPETSIEVFLVTSRPNASKTFYQGGYAPGGENKAPDCSSSDGVYPDANVESPQNDTCQLCPNNAWGSKIGITGKKSKACQDYKLIVLVLAAMPEKAFALRIPAASLKAFGAYIGKLKMSSVPANAARTRISLGATEYPSLLFDFAGTVETKEQYDAITALGQSVEVLHAVKIEPRIPQIAAPAAPVVTAQQPVVVPTPAPVAPVVAEVPVPAPVVAPEPVAVAEPGLADLLGAKTKKTKKADKPLEVEVLPPETPAPAETTPNEPVDQVTSLDGLLSKLKKQ